MFNECGHHSAAEPPLGHWVLWSGSSPTEADTNLQEYRSTEGKRRLVKSCNVQIKHFIKSDTAYLCWRGPLTELTSTILSKQRLLYCFAENPLQRTEFAFDVNYYEALYIMYVVGICGCKMGIGHIINKVILLYQNWKMMCLCDRQKNVLSFLTSFHTNESFLQFLVASHKNNPTEWNSSEHWEHILNKKQISVLSLHSYWNVCSLESIRSALAYQASP